MNLTETPKALIVTQSNHITNAAYKLTLNEQRVMLLILTKIDSIKEFDGKSEFTITAQEMVDTFGMEKKSSYGQLAEVGDNLFERKLTLPLKGRKRFIRTRWVSDIEYNEGEGSITVNVAPKMLPLLTELKGNFTSYELAYTAKFKSSYSHRIYQILAQWKSVGVVKIPLDGFRQRLQLTTRYEQYKFLKAEILKPALAEINKHSNFKVQLMERKIGKRVTAIEFRFNEKSAPKTTTLKPSKTPPNGASIKNNDLQTHSPKNSSLANSAINKGLKQIIDSTFADFIQ